MYGNGVIYKIASTGSFAYTILHTFNNTLLEGANPHNGLLKAADGALYGCTNSGGNFGNGTIYKITTGGVFSVIHHFSGASEGWSCYRKLVQGYGNDKNLYGVCYLGGAGGGGYGTVFRTDTTGKAFTVLHYFTNLDGRYPGTVLTVEPDTSLNKTKALYGGTSQGGAFSHGTLFKLDPAGPTYTLLYDFGTAAGYSTEFGGPMPLIAGVLYGEAANGGTHSNGVLFKYDLAGSGYSVIHHFDNNAGEGYQPYGGLAVDGANTFYGTCYGGGAGLYGTVWKFTPGSGTFTVLHSFGGTVGGGDGAHPYGGVVFDPGSGLLWGTTMWGGTADYGTVFNQTTGP
jgi:uncharacterized repeat protein (TIGR03803 family)